MEWLKTAVIRPEIAFDEFVIMPNHIHTIITIMECDDGPVGAPRRGAPTAAPAGRTYEYALRLF